VPRCISRVRWSLTWPSELTINTCIQRTCTRVLYQMMMMMMMRLMYCVVQKDNDYRPYDMDQVRHIAWQLCKAVKCMQLLCHCFLALLYHGSSLHSFMWGMRDIGGDGIPRGQQVPHRGGYNNYGRPVILGAKVMGRLWGQGELQTCGLASVGRCRMQNSICVLWFMVHISVHIVCRMTGNWIELCH